MLRGSIPAWRVRRTADNGRVEDGEVSGPHPRPLPEPEATGKGHAPGRSRTCDTRSGLPTSPTSRPGRAGSMSPWWSTPSAGGSSAGRCATRSRRRSWWTRSGWRRPPAARRPGRSTIRIAAASTPRRCSGARWPSRAFSPPWAAAVARMTTPPASRRSRASRPSWCTVARSELETPPARWSSAGSRAGTTAADAIRFSATSHPPTSRAVHQRPRALRARRRRPASAT